jgi:hypothetical protein
VFFAVGPRISATSRPKESDVAACSVARSHTLTRNSIPFDCLPLFLDRPATKVSSRFTALCVICFPLSISSMIAMGNFDFTSLARHEFPTCLPKMVCMYARHYMFLLLTANCVQFTSDVPSTLKPSKIVFDKDGERLRVVMHAEVQIRTFI